MSQKLKRVYEADCRSRRALLEWRWLTPTTRPKFTPSTSWGSSTGLRGDVVFFAIVYSFSGVVVRPGDSNPFSRMRAASCRSVCGTRPITVM